MLSTVLVVVDLFVSAKPVRFLHFYQPGLAVLVYGMFSLIYQKSGNGPIYSILDWDKSATLGYIFALVIIGSPLMHFGIFGLYHLRMIIYRSLCGRTNIENIDLERVENQKF